MVSNRTIIKFDAMSVKHRMKNKYIQEQTRRFTVYAEQELELMIQNHTFRNDTYNTENSYCWCVYFNGKLETFGFNVSSARGFKKSRYHGKEVDGRQEAMAFIRKYKPNNTKGWEVVWAATTPYTTYLESGTSRAGKFLVISSQYDSIKKTFGNKGKVEFKIEY